VVARLSLRPALVGFLLAACVVPAAVAAPTRDEYVAATEPICKQETLANRGLLLGVEGMVERGEMRPASHRLLRAGSALDATLKRLAPLPRPAADRARLGRWLRYARRGSALLRQMGLALKRGDRHRSERLAAILLRETKRANATVVGFGFDYCRLNPARFV
jgi:hypothetical protein